MRQVCQRLRGAFTLVAVDVRDPDAVVGARRNSPLVVGRGDGENFLASDVAAFIAYTRDAVELGQDQVAEVRADGITVTGFDGLPAEVRDYHVDWDLSAAEKAGFEYFMLKEIAEQPHAIADALLGRVGGDGRLALDEMRLSDDELRDVDKIIIVACGTAYHAGMIAKYAIEHWSQIPCEVELASEFRYRDPILTRSTLVIAISQSGETMDTLMAVRHAREQRSRVHRDLQRQWLVHPARNRRGGVHARRPRDRGRVDEGLPHPARRLLPDGALPGPGARHACTTTRSASCWISCSRCRPRWNGC